MRRRRLLAFAPLAALALVRCADDAPRATVRVNSPTTAAGSPRPGAGASPTELAAPEVVLSSDTAPQGGTILVSLVGNVTAGSVTFLGRTYELTKGARSIYTFVGVATEDSPGPATMTIGFTLGNGSRGSLAQEIVVEPTEWTTDEVTIPEAVLALLSPAITADETAQLAGVYAGLTREKLWDGGWLQPSGGPITTRFGEVRSYNGAPPSGHHSGADIGTPEGIEVVATNGGRIAMARQLRQRGNMVVVDHGGGLFSGYAHLASFAVAEGQPIARGQVLGYVGTSGLSTGAHLHWEMCAGGVLVDAIRFADGSNGF